MKNQQKVPIPRVFIFVALGLGILLFVFGIIGGNNPIIHPDLTIYAETLLQNQVSGKQLAEWTIKGKQNFVVAGFRTKAECEEQQKITSVFSCYDIKKLEDSRWIRNQFENINMPLIVYGNQSEDGLRAAALLTHLKYNVRLLEGGFNAFEKRFLQQESATINVDETNETQIQRLAVYRYFTGNDPMVKLPGQKLSVSKTDSENEQVDEEEVVERSSEGC